MLYTLQFNVTGWHKGVRDDALIFDPPRPMLFGIAQIVVIYPSNNGKQACLVMTSGDRFDVAATVEQVAAALGTTKRLT